MLVHLVHELHELLGRPVPGGRGEVAQHLVAPRDVERVLGHRQELADVRGAELLDMGHELLREARGT